MYRNSIGRSVGLRKAIRTVGPLPIPALKKAWSVRHFIGQSVKSLRSQMGKLLWRR